LKNNIFAPDIWSDLDLWHSPRGTSSTVLTLESPTYAYPTLWPALVPCSLLPPAFHPVVHETTDYSMMLMFLVFSVRRKTGYWFPLDSELETS